MSSSALPSPFMSSIDASPPRPEVALLATLLPLPTLVSPPALAPPRGDWTWLIDRGVRFSVGMVGLREYLSEIEALRAELPPDVYLWVNAYKREPDYYPDDVARRLEGIDPLFPVNNRYHASRGESCRAGASVMSVDGDGTVRRCHFIKTPIGNIYEPGFEAALIERPCTNDTCGCHIGYVHLDRLKLYDTFGPGVLERVPLGYR